MEITEKKINILEFKSIESDASDEEYMHYIFKRLSAKEKTFTKVIFKYSTFDHCYFRSCTFDSCDFTGCKFIYTNFEGSDFTGCIFDYSTFHQSNITEHVLDNNCPSFENMRLKFARTLRKNFQTLGNNNGVNKAINVELEATKSYLHKGWNSNQSYYRKKYKKWRRWMKFLEWFKFKIEEFVWGNGESLWKLLRAVLIVILFITIRETYINGDPNSLSSYFSSAINSPSIFFSIEKPKNYTNLSLSFIFFLRLFFFGLFISILVKRFNKR